MITYKINEDVSFNTSVAVDTNYDLRFTLGLTYNFSQSKNLSIIYVENMRELTEMVDSCLILQLFYDTHAYKVPLFLCNQAENTKGKLISMALVFAANLAAYGTLKYAKSQKEPDIEKKYSVQFGHYIQALDRLKDYVNDRRLRINQNLAHETSV